MVLGLAKDFFRTLLELSVLNSFFIFNGNFYRQIEGLGMGLPLGPMGLSCCQSIFHLLIFLLSLLITTKSGPSSHIKTSFLSPCNLLWCINLVVHSVYLSTLVLPCVRSTPELLSMRVGASELELLLLLLLILTLEPMHSLAVALLKLTILIF